MKDRQKEIQYRRYEILQEMKQLKKELVQLRNEENQIYGETKIKKKGKRYESQDLRFNSTRKRNNFE